MPRHFAFVAPTAVPRAPRSLVPPSLVPPTACAAGAAPRLSRRSQSSLHLDWIRAGSPAPFAPAAPAAGASAGPSAAERWAEEMRAALPRAAAPVAGKAPAASAAPAATAGPSAAERWVEEEAARRASAAASMKAMNSTKALFTASATLTQAQRTYYARMDRFVANHVGADGTAPAEALKVGTATTGAKTVKPKAVGASGYTPAFNATHVPSYTKRSPAAFVPSFKSYASAPKRESSAVVPSVVTNAAKTPVGDTADAASTSVEDAVVSPPRFSQAQHAARLARLSRLAKSTPTPTVAVSDTAAAKGTPVYSDAQARWARLSEHAISVGGAAAGAAADGERVVEKVSAADLKKHAEEARERVANEEIARDLAMRKSQMSEASETCDDVKRGKELVRGGSGFATFAAANGSAAMSPLAIAAVNLAGAANGDVSEEEAIANAQQTFVSSTVITLFLAVCLVCGDRFSDLVQFATGQGMFM